MMPLYLFIFGLIVIGSLGLLVFIKSLFFSQKELNKGDVYLRVTILFVSIFHSLATTGGVYYVEPTIIAIEPYWAVVPFSVAVVSLFATIYAWLAVFGKRKEGEL